MSEAFGVDPHRLFEILSTQILSNTPIFRGQNQLIYFEKTTGDEMKEEEKAS